MVYVGLGKMIRKKTVLSSLDDIIRRVGVWRNVRTGQLCCLAILYDEFC